MKDVPTLFDEIGGTAKAAKLLGVKPTAASEMKRRSRIPVWYWPRLVDVCRDMGIRGVNYDVLVALHQKPEKAA
jgi:hypothetical protein